MYIALTHTLTLKHTYTHVYVYIHIHTYIDKTTIMYIALAHTCSSISIFHIKATKTHKNTDAQVQTSIHKT